MQKTFHPTIFKYLLITPSSFVISKKVRGDTCGVNKELCVKLLLKTGKEIISRKI
jgi:hypothetical protein